jgi:hypothetical protein
VDTAVPPRRRGRGTVSDDGCEVKPRSLVLLLGKNGGSARGRTVQNEEEGQENEF